MNTRNANSSLVAALRARFTEEAVVTDHWLQERGWDPNDDSTAFAWVEAFADRTAEAVRRGDAKSVQEHTNFIAAAYRAEPDTLRTIVDVSYAENLMWEATAAEKKWAWSFIAEDIRKLYADMWGDPTLGKR